MHHCSVAINVPIVFVKVGRCDDNYLFFCSLLARSKSCFKKSQVYLDAIAKILENIYKAIFPYEVGVLGSIWIPFILLKTENLLLKTL